MKWIYIEGKFIPVQNCVRINFSSMQRENDYIVTMNVEDVNGNTTCSSYYSKVDKLCEKDVRGRFYKFVCTNSRRLFDFNEMCSTIEQLNSSLGDRKELV